MKTLSAILVETGKPLVLDYLDIPKLQPGQVLVEIKYSGVCHTQLLEARGKRGKDPYLPHCLGHEGSGIIKEISPGITKVKVGDPVILSWIKGTGCNVLGSQYQWGSKKVNAGGITTLSHYAILSENRVYPLPKTFPLKQAALIGCAIPTGLGSVFNTAKPSPGQSIAIFGCGGIGLAALQAARIAGCFPIIAIDINKKKLDIAKNLGASHIIKNEEEDVSQIIASITSLDFAIEATGIPFIMQKALECVKPQGGTAVIIGNANQGDLVSLDPWQLNQGKRLLGSWGGDNIPDRDFPRYCKLIEAGLFQCQDMSADEFSLESVNEAFNLLEAGRVVRPIIKMK